MLFSLHNTLAYVCLGAMALHLLLHAGYLAEFLSGLRCSGCGKHCPLSHPRCARGEMQAQQATEEYYQTYGESTAASAPYSCVQMDKACRNDGHGSVFDIL